MSSRANMERFDKRPNFQTALATISDGKYAPVPGGVLIKNEVGQLIGAVGVTGDTSDNDELCAILGIHAVNLQSDPPEPHMKH